MKSKKTDKIPKVGNIVSASKEEYIGGQKRTEFERERDLEILSDLRLKGYKQSEMAVKLKELTNASYSITQQQVSEDLALLTKRWQTAAIDNIDTLKNIELAKLDVLERQAWQSFEKSLSAKTKTVVGRMPKMKKGDQEQEILENINHGPLLIQQTITTEEVGGNAVFLNVILNCIKQRAEILGLKTAKMEVQVNDLAGKSTAELMQMLLEFGSDETKNYLFSLGKKQLKANA